MLKKDNFLLSIFVSVILFLSIPHICYSSEQAEGGWEMFGKWYEWKKHAQLLPQQKEIIDYFEKAGKLIEKIEAIWMEGAGTMHPKPSPEEAIKLIDKILADFKILHVPNKCEKHYEASLLYIRLARKYEEAVKKYGTENEETLKVTGESLQYESTRFTEYWRVLREVGLFDNFEEEAINLGLLSKKELDKEYGFSREFKTGESVICPDCGGQMKRVKILYQGDQGYDQDIKNNQKDYIFGEKRFAGCPEYGYKCDKCNKWYEEYPAQNADSVIIRNWGWGWHELVYKKHKHL